MGLNLVSTLLKNETSQWTCDLAPSHMQLMSRSTIFWTITCLSLWGVDGIAVTGVGEGLSGEALHPLPCFPLPARADVVWGKEETGMSVGPVSSGEGARPQAPGLQTHPSHPASGEFRTSASL